jgi:hypothetical protein
MTHTASHSAGFTIYLILLSLFALACICIPA